MPKPHRWRSLPPLLVVVLLIVAAIASLLGLMLTVWAITQNDGQRRLLENDGRPLSGTAGRSTDGPNDYTGPLPTAASYRVWDRNVDGRPVRWNACEPVEFVVNPAGGPADWLAVFEEALDTVGEAAGLTLAIVGHTDERPVATRPAFDANRHGQRWSPVLVAWAEPHEGNLPLSLTDRGVAIPLAVGYDGQRTFVSGQVVFNAARARPSHAWPGRHELSLDFASRATGWGSTMIHELLHLIGLDHVDDSTQLMYAYPGDGPVEFGPGDLAGLKELNQGCVDSPAPTETAAVRLGQAG